MQHLTRQRLMGKVLKMGFNTKGKAREIITPFMSRLTNISATTEIADNIEDRIDMIFEEIDSGKRDPVIRQLLSEILKDVTEKDYEGELQAIFDWVRKNIRYTRDPHNLELFQKPSRIIELGLADCDDLSIIIGAMVQSIGYPLRLRVIGVQSADPEHIYPLVGVPPSENNLESIQWVAMDASVNQPIGWQLPQNQLKSAVDYEDTDS